LTIFAQLPVKIKNTQFQQVKLSYLEEFSFKGKARGGEKAQHTPCMRAFFADKQRSHAHPASQG